MVSGKWLGEWSKLTRMAARSIALALAALLLALPATAQITASAGQTLYRNSNTWGGASGICSSCHFPNVPAPGAVDGQGSDHPQAANNFAKIITAFNTGGRMVGQFGNAAFTMSNDNARVLSLFIGQYKPPLPANASIATRSGVAKVLDVYGLLPIDGSSGVAQDAGGITVANSTQGVTPTITRVTNVNPPQYNITYSPGATFAGTDTYTYNIINPTTSAAGVQATVSVTVYGITNVSMTASAIKGVNNANWFTATTNGGGTFSSSNLTAQTGLTISAGGVVSGTPTATGSFNVNVTVTTPLVGGSVTRTLVLDIAGITSPATLNLSQNSATNLPYTITAFPSAQAPFLITAGALPAGLGLVGNQITGTPTVSGPFQVTLQAGTPLGNVSQVLDISVGPVPVITSAPAVPAAPSIYVAGVTGTAITNIQINATNGPISAYSAVGIAAATGLSVNASGLISGIPSLSGDFPVALAATNVNGTGTQNVILRINSNVAPNITSAAAAAPVNVGANGTVYTVTANNGPITAYAVVGPSTLPTGLTINPTTGVVSGIPTVSGTFTTTLSATNSGGLTGSRVVSFTINPTVVPVITSPTFASLAVGAPMAPLQVVATNPPILSYAVQGGSALPAGLTLNTTTGVITGTPSTPGPITTILTATNAAGPSLGLSVPFTIGLPAPSACAMTVPLNVATTLDLRSCMFPAFTPTGMSVLATPAHGSVSVSGTQATFTPANNYFGTDTFTVVGYFNGGGVSSAGVVTVTVTGRPDPSQDATVTALLTAQADTAQRFARAQISNIQRRMESLHRREEGASGIAPSLQAARSRPIAPRSTRCRTTSPTSTPRAMPAASSISRR